MYVSLKETTIIRKCENGDYLIINLSSHNSVLVSKDAADFITHISTIPCDIKELAHNIAAEYDDVSYDEVYSDLVEFFDKLAEQDLVAVGETIADASSFHLFNLHVEITFRCNERCIHCYIPNYVKDAGASMDPDLFFRLVDEFVSLGGIEITLSGGEPTLHPHFADFINYCNNKGLIISIFSNLLNLRPQIVELLKKSKIGSVQTSIYSMDSRMHDAITGVEGSLARTLNGVRMLKDLNIDVSISSPIMNVNAQSAEGIIDFAKQNGMTLRMSPMLSAKSDGDTGFLSEGRLSHEQHRDLMMRLLEYEGEYVKENLLELNLDAENALVNHTEAFLSSNICSIGVDHLCVSGTGLVYPCPGGEKIKVGDFTKESLTHIWYNSSKLNELRKANKQSRHHQCLTCPTLRYCKRCFLQSVLEGSVGCFHRQTCEDARMRCGVLATHPLFRL